MFERNEKDEGEDSPKQASLCWCDRHSGLAARSANLHPPGVLFANAILPFSLLALLLRVFPFVFFAFVFLLALKPRPFVESFFEMHTSTP